MHSWTCTTWPQRRVAITPVWSAMRREVHPAPHISLSKVGPHCCRPMLWPLSLPCPCPGAHAFSVAAEPAAFVKKLSDFSVEQGKAIMLESTYTGSPPIAVTWKKDGVQIAQSPRCSITATDKSGILEILNSTKEDEGQYSCEVTNEAGQDRCQGLVSVLGMWLFPAPQAPSPARTSYEVLALCGADCGPLCPRPTLLCGAPGEHGGEGWRGGHFPVPGCRGTRHQGILVQGRHKAEVHACLQNALEE